MIIIGEKINATRKAIATALEARDAQTILQTAREQLQAGRHYLDVNGGDPRPGREAKNMAWLMETGPGPTSTRPLCIDSANPQAVKTGLSMAKKKPILNSISLESTDWNRSALLEQFDCMVIGLLMSDQGAAHRRGRPPGHAAKLIERLTGGRARRCEDIIIDPASCPSGHRRLSGRAVIDAIAAIHSRWPEVHIGGGCSNISFGLPKRQVHQLRAAGAGDLPRHGHRPDGPLRPRNRGHPLRGRGRRGQGRVLHELRHRRAQRQAGLARRARAGDASFLDRPDTGGGPGKARVRLPRERPALSAWDTLRQIRVRPPVTAIPLLCVRYCVGLRPARRGGCLGGPVRS